MDLVNIRLFHNNTGEKVIMQRANSKNEENMDELYIRPNASNIQARRFKIKRDEGNNEKAHLVKRIFKKSREVRLNLFMSEIYLSERINGSKNLKHTSAELLCERSA